eukprot:TRINITY_DN26455_c0_g1_i1.p1 TRINITY_DN26455_c0_g1~~TRINITY_DN26455_c0_g1_i1.p1  ORF type:complete len:323 (-),score=48.27 TRINITY_DN26455_c0_g1_i1:59-1027(-)
MGWDEVPYGVRRGVLLTFLSVAVILAFLISLLVFLLSVAQVTSHTVLEATPNHIGFYGLDGSCTATSGVKDHLPVRWYMANDTHYEELFCPWTTRSSALRISFSSIALINSALIFIFTVCNHIKFLTWIMTILSLVIIAMFFVVLIMDSAAVSTSHRWCANGMEGTHWRYPPGTPHTGQIDCDYFPFYLTIVGEVLAFLLWIVLFAVILTYVRKYFSKVDHHIRDEESMEMEVRAAPRTETPKKPKRDLAAEYPPLDEDLRRKKTPTPAAAKTPVQTTPAPTTATPTTSAPPSATKPRTPASAQKGRAPVVDDSGEESDFAK